LHENRGKGIAVRRAFYIPHFSNPPGPRSGPLRTPEAASRFVRRIYDFVTNELRDYVATSSHFAVILHPCISPNPLRGEAGCHAYLLQRGSHDWAIIRAAYGNDEGVMELRGSVDEYEVDLSIDKITSSAKHIHPKGLTLTEKGAKEVRLPPSLSRRPVLLEDQIHEISALLRRFYLRWPPGKHRLEFSLTSEGIFFTECANYTDAELSRLLVAGKGVSTSKLERIDGRVGTVVRIDESKDSGLSKVSDAMMIYVPSMKRDRMIAATLRIAKGAKSGVIILVPGSLGSHTILRLREFAQQERKPIYIMSTLGKSVEVYGDGIKVDFDPYQKEMKLSELRHGQWVLGQVLRLSPT